MGTAKILIIDDDGRNGVKLANACNRLAPGWDLLWFRVIQDPDPLDDEDNELGDVTYRVIGKMDEAAEAIREAARDAACDLIVFYDLQLSGVQEATPDAYAAKSQITSTLKSLMDEPERRMLINIHSAELAAHVIAQDLDKQRLRTMIGDVVTGKEREWIQQVVRKTMATWNNLYPSEALSSDEFLDLMEGMSHQQIQNYPEFLKDRMAQEEQTRGKQITEDEKQKIAEAARLKYPNPKDVLRRYLVMGVPEFEENFCDDTKNLKGEVIEALKSISGVFSLEQDANMGRPLTWGGAWLLALGVFRQLLARDTWKKIFNVGDLRGAQQEGGGAQQKWPSIHAMQRPPRRAETVRLFVKMTRVLFTKRGTTNESILEKVELTVNPQTRRPYKLSFRLSFPCVGDDDQSESLLGRVVGHVDNALAVAEGRRVEYSGEGRDTSRAIWRFFLSAAICDSKDVMDKPGYGMAGGFSPMNIMSIDENRKTEVLWLN